MTITVAKSNLRWLRAVMNDDDLEPASRIAGAVYAAICSTRRGTVGPEITDRHRVAVALTVDELATGAGELRERGYLTESSEGTHRVVLSFPAGTIPPGPRPRPGAPAPGPVAVLR